MKHSALYYRNKGNPTRDKILILLLRRPIGRSPIGSLILHFMLTIVLNVNSDNKNLRDNIKKYKKLGYRYIALDCLAACFKYGITSTEYFLYSFYDLKSYDRATWIGDTYRYCLSESNNDLNSWETTRDKWLFYRTYRIFMKRDIVFLDSSSVERVVEWCLTRDGFIVKPRFGTGGFGIEVYRSCIDEDSIRTYLKNKVDKGEFVLEELISQHPDMASFNPQSVNTVRIMSIVNNQGDVDLLGAIFRMGNGHFVDNYSSGGLIASVDMITGVVDSLGKTKVTIKQEGFEFHPCTHQRIKGFQIPFWAETIEMVRELAALNSGLRSVGWDIAITNNGPELIEGNRFWDVHLFQVPGNKGKLEKILPYIDKRVLLPVHRIRFASKSSSKGILTF